MIRKFNEYIAEGFYYPEPDKNSDDEMDMGSMPEESGDEDPSWKKRPEMKIGDHDTKGLFYEIDQAVFRLMQRSGLSMREIMDHISDVAQSYRSSGRMKSDSSND